MPTEKKLTGYPSIDKPWNRFYEGVEKRSIFLNSTPYQGLIKNNADYPNEIALEYFGAKVTFGELIRNTDIVAKSLEAYGVKKGDYVTICSTTTPEVIYTFYAISKIGAVANVISPFYTPEELLARIDECGSKLIIMVDKFLPKFKELLFRDADKKIVVLPMMNSSVLRFISPKYIIDGKTNEVAWKTFIKDGACRNDAAVDPYAPQKPQAMVYSSGTTGASKGIVLSVDSFQKLINAYGNSGFDTSRKQKVYQNIPPWHSTGLSLGINFPLSFGVQVCIDPRFDHTAFVKNVLKFKPEYILTNTSMYQGFTFEKSLKLLEGKSLAFLKYPVEGGEPLTEKDIANIEGVFRNHGSKARLLNGYGECECGATVTTDITSQKFSNTASGIPLPDITTVGIFDDDFKELKYGERGNILVKTEIGMIEYFNNSEATAEFFHIDENGDRWSKTGDIGYMNEDGSLVVLGRKSDYSVIDGTQIYNFDIERAILSSEKVKLCEIQTHPEDNNRLVAHIVWENDTGALLRQNPEKQMDYFAEIQKLVEHVIKLPEAVPHSFCIWDSFPSAHSGKRDVPFIKKDVEGIIKI
ncbi:MAG: acyl--CoA ligase [Oscillospiraceae bacterium]|nr:acyl--CoA ligase [Oscillospiraceae bacterium]